MGGPGVEQATRHKLNAVPHYVGHGDHFLVIGGPPTTAYRFYQPNHHTPPDTILLPSPPLGHQIYIDSSSLAQSISLDTINNNHQYINNNAKVDTNDNEQAKTAMSSPSKHRRGFESNDVTAGDFRRYRRVKKRRWVLKYDVYYIFTAIFIHDIMWNLFNSHNKSRFAHVLKSIFGTDNIFIKLIETIQFFHFICWIIRINEYSACPCQGATIIKSWLYLWRMHQHSQKLCMYPQWPWRPGKQTTLISCHISSTRHSRFTRLRCLMFGSLSGWLTQHHWIRHAAFSSYWCQYWCQSLSA